MTHMAAAKLVAMCHILNMQGLPNGRNRIPQKLPRVAPLWRHVSRAPGTRKMKLLSRASIFLELHEYEIRFLK